LRSSLASVRLVIVFVLVGGSGWDIFFVMRLGVGMRQDLNDVIAEDAEVARCLLRPEDSVVFECPIGKSSIWWPMSVFVLHWVDIVVTRNCSDPAIDAV
jgi:hypothetical protein